MNATQLNIGQASPLLPIVQGGMAVRISTEALASAVCNRGAVGTIGASGMSPDELRARIRNAKAFISPNAAGLLAVNLMRALYDFWQLLDVCVEEKVDVVFVGAGLPEAEMYRRAQGIPIVPIVSRSGVLVVLIKRTGVVPPAVVVESGLAGGHLGPKDPSATTWELLPRITETLRKLKDEGHLAQDIPIIAAGGILTGEDVYRAFAMGASGVQLGTRFALSTESNACDLWKETLLNAAETVITQSPVGLPGRVVETELVRRIAQGRAPKVNSLQRCQKCLRDCGRNYCIFAALEKAQEKGDQEDGLFFSGARVGEISEVLPASEIIDDLVRGYSAARSGPP